MNQPASCETAGEPIALDMLVTADPRRTATVNDQLHFQRCISTDERGVDEIDRKIDDMIVDPYECHAPTRRSDKDLGEFLSLLDSLETGKDRKETTR